MIEIREIKFRGLEEEAHIEGGIACGIGTCSGSACGIGCGIASGSACGLGCPK